jgi:hypothetical protein
MASMIPCNCRRASRAGASMIREPPGTGDQKRWVFHRRHRRHRRQAPQVVYSRRVAVPTMCLRLDRVPTIDRRQGWECRRSADDCRRLGSSGASNRRQRKPQWYRGLCRLPTVPTKVSRPQFTQEGLEASPPTTRASAVAVDRQQVRSIRNGDPVAGDHVPQAGSHHGRVPRTEKAVLH